jgi:hypothetical protein
MDNSKDRTRDSLAYARAFLPEIQHDESPEDTESERDIGEEKPG